MRNNHPACLYVLPAPSKVRTPRGSCRTILRLALLPSRRSRRHPIPSLFLSLSLVYIHIVISVSISSRDIARGVLIPSVRGSYFSSSIDPLRSAMKSEILIRRNFGEFRALERLVKRSYKRVSVILSSRVYRKDKWDAGSILMVF